MKAFARWLVRHKALVGLCWLVVFGAGAFTMGSVNERLDAGFSFPGQAGYEANEEILAKYGNGGPGHPLVPVLTLAAGSTVDDPPVGGALSAAFAELDGQGLRTVGYPGTGDRAFVSTDGRTTWGLVYTPYFHHDADKQRAELSASVETTLKKAFPGAEIRLTGLDKLAETEEEDEGASATTLTEALIGAAAALIILAVTFGSLLAFTPLLVAAVSILSGFLVVFGLTFVIGIADLVQYVLVFVGLGVAIDYALLFVTRWREERQNGLDAEGAVVAAMATAGRAVVVSGATVAVGLTVLAVIPSPGLRSMAVGGVLVPLFSALVTLTLLPVLLAAQGDRLEWPHRARAKTVGRLWTRWASAVYRRRWLAMAAALAILVPLGIAALNLRLGDAPSEVLVKPGPARAALDTAKTGGMPTGLLTPIEVVVPEDADETALASRLRTVDGVRTVVMPDTAAWDDGDTRIVGVLPVAESSTAAGQETVGKVRDLVRDTEPSARVGGSGAQLIDEIDDQYGLFPLLLLLIALVSFVVLARAFRSLVLAAQAVVLNLLSVGAAYGALVLVWQEGYGSQLIWGIPALGSVSTTVPLLTFAFLFGLSMDYEVFLLARMREEYDLTGSTHAAVVTGLGRVGRLVTCAALILFVSFASLAALPEIHAKVMATGLGAAILLDATVLRMLLLPALVAISGRWTWWMPERVAAILRVPPSTVDKRSTSATATGR
ncbi:MMPL family transporter [Amycolatopsis thailandensis]|uniref:MMPL family transporter n=1 Tax=Amycolatopsis thailandensis TaxID=589330 RepID=UPI00365E204C